MTPNRVSAIAFRWLISAVFTLCVFAPKVHAQSAANAISGVYNGTYTCAMGPRTLKLSLLASGNGSLTGVFTFYLPPTSHTKAFSYSMRGTFEAVSGKFKLNPVKWETPPPGGYVMVGMDGAFDPGAGQVAGKITYTSCGAFQATRDQAESANIASVIGQQTSSTGTTQPIAGTTVVVRAPAQAQNQQEHPYICSNSYSDRQTSRSTFYRTGVFQAAASPQTINDAWATYVRKTYHLRDVPGPKCDLVHSDAAGQQYTQTYMDQMAQAQKMEIVHVDWKYTPDQATAPVAQAAPAATAAQPPATAVAPTAQRTSGAAPGQDTPPRGRIINYYCFAYFSQSSKSNYASSVFAAPMNLDTDIMAKDFAQFVKEKYQSGERGEKVTGVCNNAIIDKGAEAGKAHEELRWRSGKWIETGWKPTTLPPVMGPR